MKYIKFKKHLTLVAVAAIVLTACKKVKTSEPMGDAGQTLVTILGSGPTTPAASIVVIQEAISFVNTPYTLKNGVIDIRRNVPNNAELNKTMVVTIKDDTAAVRAANPAYINMPAAWYTIQASDNVAKVGGVGGTWTFTFKPGEFAKQIYITIPNATLMDPSSLYGLGFTISTADQNGKIIVDAKTVVIQIGAKNDWDGRYDDKFFNYHPTNNPGYTGDDVEVWMITTGANKVKIYWPGNGYYNPSVLAGSLNAFAAQEPEYTVNTSTNAVTVQNAYVGATTFYTMAVGWPNNWDPVGKKFVVKWGYSYTVPGVFDAGCREWNQVLTYLGPR